MLEKQEHNQNKLEQNKSNMEKHHKTRNQLKKTWSAYFWPSKNVLIDAMESKSLMVKWTITCQLCSVFLLDVFTTFIYVHSFLDHLPIHATLEEKPINRTLDLNRELVGHMLQSLGTQDALTSHSPGLRLSQCGSLWGNPDWRVKFVYIVPSIYLAWLCLLQIWGLLADDHQQRWPKCIRCDPTLGHLDFGKLDTKRINGVWRGTRSHDDIFPTTKKHQHYTVLLWISFNIYWLAVPSNPAHQNLYAYLINFILTTSKSTIWNKHHSQTYPSWHPLTPIPCSIPPLME